MPAQRRRTTTWDVLADRRPSAAGTDEGHGGRTAFGRRDSATPTETIRSLFERGWPRSVGSPGDTLVRTLPRVGRSTARRWIPFRRTAPKPGSRPATRPPTRGLWKLSRPDPSRRLAKLLARRMTEDLDQRADVNRLHEVVIEAGRPGPLPVPLLAPPRLGNEQHCLELRVLPDALGELVAVHLRQPDVDECHVGCELRGDEQGLFAVEGDAGLVPHEFEHLAEAVCLIGIVVDDQDLPLQATALARSGEVPADRARRRRAQVGRWEDHAELAALPRTLARQIDRSVVHQDEAPDESQPDAETLAEDVRGDLSLLEHLEDPRLGFLGDADAV